MKPFPGQNISAVLLTWGEGHLRPLPWRKNRSLYHTILSEFMLQQTQVQTVIPYFDRWIHRFPSLESVARGSEEEILKHWEGLGYYARARNLHRLCQMLHSADVLPVIPAEWRKFPGVGPYTAVAISSIGQNFDAIAMDGNIIRVLARLGGILEIFKNKSTAECCLRPLADALIVPDRCALINESLMDLGATICIPHGGRCADCPLKAFCQAHMQNLPIASIPAFPPLVYENIITYRLLVFRHGKILLQASKRRRLNALYEFPQLCLRGIPSANVPLIGDRGDIAADEDFPMNFQIPGENFTANPHFIGRRTIGHRRYEERFIALKEHFSRFIDLSQGPLRWATIEDLDTLTLSGPHRRWLAHLLDYPSDGTTNGKSRGEFPNGVE
jgi:A/G-specific adenine glycosylase